MHNVEILYFTGCPNFRKTCDVVCKVLESEQVEFELHIKPVKNESIESNPQFIGSPTVLVDGFDVEVCFNKGSSWDEPVEGLACRLYDCEVSKECPSEEMILCALREH